MAGTVKKDGATWYFVLDLGKDAHGKRQQKKKRGFKTKKEAHAALVKLENELVQGSYVEPSKMRYGEFLTNWLEDKKTKVKKSTHRTYQWLVEKHICPALGHNELRKITPMMIQSYYNQLYREGSLSGAIIQKIHTLINDSLKKAERWELISKNVASLVDRPKASRRDLNVWTLEQSKTFLKVSVDDRLYLAFHLALTTGMRQSEILGLRWKDVNYEDLSISVTQILSHDGKSLNSGSKTASSIRKVHVPQETIKLLERHFRKSQKEKEMYAELYSDHGLVICTSVGTPVIPRNLMRSFYRLIEKAKLPKIRFHDLRHTHATLLLSQGVNPKIVAERLGHADVRITLDTYSHLLPSMQKETAQNFGKIMFGDQ